MEIICLRVLENTVLKIFFLSESCISLLNQIVIVWLVSCTFWKGVNTLVSTTPVYAV